LERASDGTAPIDEPALVPTEALGEAQRLLDSGHAFAAHEVLEAVWKSTPGPDRALWQGLAQLAVGLTHRARRNEAGAQALLLRGASTLASVDGCPWHVPVPALRAWASTAATQPDQAGSMPRLTGQAADDRA
jgi:hypothetical protein